MDTYCNGCVYHSMSIGCCDYLEIEGHLRGCKGGEGCTKYRAERLHTKRRVDITIAKKPEKKASKDKEKKEKQESQYVAMAKRRMDLYEQGYSDIEIAIRVGTTRGAIQSWRQKRNLPLKIDCRKMDEEKEQIRIDLYQLGMSDRAMAEALNVAIKNISSWRQRKGWTANPGYGYGGRPKSV